MDNRSQGHAFFEMHPEPKGKVPVQKEKRIIAKNHENGIKIALALYSF